MLLENVPVFIPAAGYGTRLLPATLAVPKPLLPLGTTPIIVDVLWEVYQAGFRKVFIIVNWREDVFRHLFEEPKELYRWLEYRGKYEFLRKVKKMIPNLRIEFVRQEILNGLGGAILLAEPYVEDKFVVVLSDNIIFESKKGGFLNILYRVLVKNNASTVFSVARVPFDQVEKFGVIKFDRKSVIDNHEIYWVSQIIEKPPKDRAPSNIVVVGRYAFDNSIFDYLKQIYPTKGEIDETQAFQMQINDNKTVLGVNLGSREWYDIGTVEGYLKAFIRYTIQMEGIEVVYKWLEEVIKKR